MTDYTDYPAHLLPDEYLDLSEEFFEAYRLLPSKGPRGPISWPKYFLFCHSIELAIKAFLLRMGVPEERLRKKEVQHNITALLDMALERGLQLSEASIHRLRLLSEAHQDYRARFPSKDGRTTNLLLKADLLHLIHLIQVVRVAVRGGPHDKYVNLLRTPHDPQPLDTTPREEEEPLLLYCPEHGGWRIGVRFEGRWLDFSDLDTQLTPTHWLPMPPDPEDDEPSPERIVPWDPEE